MQTPNEFIEKIKELSPSETTLFSEYVQANGLLKKIIPVLANMSAIAEDELNEELAKLDNVLKKIKEPNLYIEMLNKIRIRHLINAIFMKNLVPDLSMYDYLVRSDYKILSDMLFNKLLEKVLTPQEKSVIVLKFLNSSDYNCAYMEKEDMAKLYGMEYDEILENEWSGLLKLRKEEKIKKEIKEYLQSLRKNKQFNEYSPKFVELIKIPKNTNPDEFQKELEYNIKNGVRESVMLSDTNELIPFSNDLLPYNFCMQSYKKAVAIVFIHHILPDVLPENRFDEFKSKVNYSELKDTLNGIFQSLTHKELYLLQLENDFNEMLVIEDGDEIGLLTGIVSYHGYTHPYNKLIRKIRLEEQYALRLKVYVENVLNREITCYNKYSNPKQEQLIKIMNQDIEEIKRCIETKSYKAAIVLCGSVLETLLSVWLSETSKDNPDNWIAKDGLTNEIPAKKIDLRYCISNMWGNVEYPYWNKDIQAKATNIRKKRNLIHSKLIENPEKEINAIECRNIFNDLKEIIEKRKEYSINEFGQQFSKIANKINKIGE